MKESEVVVEFKPGKDEVPAVEPLLGVVIYGLSPHLLGWAIVSSPLAPHTPGYVDLPPLALWLYLDVFSPPKLQ